MRRLICFAYMLYTLFYMFICYILIFRYDGMIVDISTYISIQSVWDCITPRMKLYWRKRIIKLSCAKISWLMFLRRIFSKALWGSARAPLLRFDGISFGSFKMWSPPYRFIARVKKRICLTYLMAMLRYWVTALINN